MIKPHLLPQKPQESWFLVAMSANQTVKTFWGHTRSLVYAILPLSLPTSAIHLQHCLQALFEFDFPPKTCSLTQAPPDFHIPIHQSLTLTMCSSSYSSDTFTQVPFSSTSSFSLLPSTCCNHFSVAVTDFTLPPILLGIGRLRPNSSPRLS
jgi:hypothetical protein